MNIPDNFIQLIRDLLRILIPYYFITYPIIQYLAEGIVISEILGMLWITSNMTCKEMSINYKEVIPFIFDILLIISLNIFLFGYSIYKKYYLALLWIIIPTIISIMKGLSCAIEDIIHLVEQERT